MATSILSSLFLQSTVVFATPTHPDIKMTAADFSLWQIFAGVLGLYVVYYIVQSIKVGAARRKIIKENGCQPAVKYPSGDPFINLKLQLENVELLKKGEFLPEARKRFLKYGNTFAVNIMGKRGMFKPPIFEWPC